MLTQLKNELKQLANPQKAKILQRFFKTAPGQYGAGDIFIGVTIPQQRQIIKKYKTLSLKEINSLLHSKIHEYRLISLLILVKKYQESNPANQQKIYNFYLKNSSYINNWDLVDLSAPKIMGHYLLNKNKKPLHTLSHSSNLWQKRIAIISTLEFIKHNKFKDTIKLSHALLQDKHDLIHKAIGWMLREIGKRDKQLLINFIDKNINHIPRTTLRYAIEKFPEQQRQFYLKK